MLAAELFTSVVTAISHVLLAHMRNRDVSRGDMVGAHRDRTIAKGPGLSNVLTEIDLNCECRSRVRNAIARFETLEDTRQANHALAPARNHRHRIGTLTALLADLYEIGWNEAESSIYLELSDLFEDIATAAREGAAATRHLHRRTPLRRQRAERPSVE